MKILGLIGSPRTLGNTELMVTEVAKSAVAVAGIEAGTVVSLLRLTDLQLNYCNGCMSCAFDEFGKCPLRDDMEYLLAELRAADAIILGSPVYTLLPPGPLKLIADRLIMYLARSAWTPPKPAVTVGVAGLPRWSEMLLPLLNCTTLSLGFRLADSLLAYGAGPGAVLLDADNLERARLAGSRLGKALLGESQCVDFGPGRCNVCGADFFRLTETGIECPLCLASGNLIDNVAVFSDTRRNRWQANELRHHFTDWIQGTGATYLEQRPDIRRLQRAYRNRDFSFLIPPSKLPNSA